MKKQTFSFSEANFNKMFPFYLLMDKELNIVSFGKNINKVMPVAIGDNFFSHMYLKRPAIASGSFEKLKLLENQLIIIGHKDDKDLVFRGQLDIYQDDCILFIGTPWFGKISRLKEKNLTVSDFPVYDSVIDLLTLIEAQEIANNDAKHLLDKVNQQSKTLQQRDEDLSATTSMLSQLIANVQNAILVEDEYRNIVFANDAFCTLFKEGSSYKSIVGTNSLNSISQSMQIVADPEGFIHGIDELIKNKETNLNQIVEFKDGKIYSRDFIPIIINDTYRGHVWKYTDITESKQLEKELQSQKQFYEQILNEMPADIAVFDNQHRYLFLNPVAIKDEEIRKWLIGKTDEEYCAYRNKDQSIAAKRRVLFNSVVIARRQMEWEEEITTPEGRTEYHLRKMYPAFNADGELTMVIGYGINITLRKKIEQQIRESETRYRSIFDNSQALICIHDLNGIILEANSASVTTFGYDISELKGAPLYKLLPPNKQADFENQYLHEIKTKGTAEGIMIALSKAGKEIYLLYQNFLVNNVGESPYVIGFSQDITARITAERELKKSEEKYRGIIENMNMGMMQVTADETIVYVNNSFCEMSGFEADELIGKNARDFFPNGANTEPLSNTNERRKKGQSDAYEVQVKNKRGNIKWWLVSGAPLIDHNGAFQGTIRVHLDISYQKAMEQELRKAKADAEFSAHSKDIFLANMSHEIRTPMNAIIGIGRLLGKTSLAQQQKSYLDIIQNASNNLLIIINDLLDFSKIEAGKVSLEHIGFELSNIIENAAQILKHKADEKNISIITKCEPGLAPVLIGDPYRINQILINLIGNSIKFTEKGGVTISCQARQTNNKNQQVLFEVTDTGVGMSNEFMKYIFSKFSQEDSSTTRKFGGTGLGMSISKQLIELMGGTITVKSKKNAGTTISFTITFSIGSQDDIPKEMSKDIDTQILRGKHILLVEDNYMNRILAHTILEQYGAMVTEAEDGAIAIEKIEHDKFDLILMDMQMPVKDGIEATRYIRNNLDTATPIIALTANAFKNEEERCLEAGMNDFISKPFEEEKFINLIARWLGSDVTHHRISAKSSFIKSEAIFDLAKIRSTSRGDESFVKKMLQIFIVEIPGSIQQMEDAFAKNDWETLAAIAHRIRPSMHSFGIASLFRDMELLEDLSYISSNSSSISENITKIKNVITNVIAAFKELLQNEQ